MCFIGCGLLTEERGLNYQKQWERLWRAFFKVMQEKCHLLWNVFEIFLRFVWGELQTALKQMSRGRCNDKAGICLEMIIDAGNALRNCLVNAYNGITRNG